MKTLNKVAVMLVAIEMMKDQGTATTLEVKEALRAEGYFAKQADVSNFMFEVAQEEGWAIDNSSTYRTYSLDANHVAAKAVVTATQSTGNPNYASAVIKHRDGSEVTVTEKEETDAVIGDWVCDHPSGMEMYFDAIYTRDEVRGAYAKINAVDFSSVTSGKIKE
jgi:hypothetical protein